MPVSVTMDFHFSAAHRLLGHKGKCKHLHGHNYLAQVTVQPRWGEKLNDDGMVADFAMLKDVIEDWIDNNWDHNAIFHPDDPLWPKLTMEENGRTPFLMPRKYANPTAEHMAIVLKEECNVRLPQDLTITCVTLWETARCAATTR